MFIPFYQFPGGSAPLRRFPFPRCCFSPQKNPRMCPTSVVGFYPSLLILEKPGWTFWEREKSQESPRKELDTKEPTPAAPRNPIPNSISRPAPAQFPPQADFWEAWTSFKLSAMGIPSSSPPWPWPDPGASLHPTLSPPGEGDPTFVTIIHLIDFQLGGSGDGGSGARCHLCHQKQFPRLWLQGMFWRFP